MPHNNPYWGQRTRDPGTRELLAEITAFQRCAGNPDLRLQAQNLIDALRFSELTLASAESALAALESRQEDALERAHLRAPATSPQPRQAQVAPNSTTRDLEALKATLTRRLKAARSPHRISYFTRRLTATHFALLRVSPKADCAQPHPHQDSRS